MFVVKTTSTNEKCRITKLPGCVDEDDAFEKMVSIAAGFVCDLARHCKYRNNYRLIIKPEEKVIQLYFDLWIGKKQRTQYYVFHIEKEAEA